LFDHIPRRLQNLLIAERTERFLPQALGLVQHGYLAKGGVVLVVVIDTEKGEHLIEGVDQVGVFGPLVSLPSYGR